MNSSISYCCVLVLLFSTKLVSAYFDGEFRELAFPAFFSFANKRLVKHTIRTEQVPDMDLCELLCYQEPNCVSVNYETGTQRCELNNSTHRAHDDEFVDKQGYFYRGADSACDAIPCNNGATCQSGFTHKRYRCLCPPGFTAEHCENDIDECSVFPSVCNINAICQNNEGSYLCSCKVGFTGDGKTCTDIEECSVFPSVCDINAICQNNEGSYICSCKVGFTGDGKTCTAVSSILSINSSYPGLLHKFLEPAVGNESHWLLCYRASSHGWDVSSFHSRCDGKRDTVTIIKKDEYVFGGYTDIPWESSGGFGYTSNAFIFSLRNKEGLAPFKSDVTRPSWAIYRSTNYGPVFGAGDIHIADNANNNTNSQTDFGNYYSVPSGVQDRRTILAGTFYFSPDELEVFYLEPSH